MIQFRKTKSRVCQTLANWRRPRETARAGETPQTKQMSQMAQMTDALTRHRAAGFETTLRQLHKICDLTQPQALSLLTQMEEAGIVTIDRNLGDAFESVIRLNKNALDMLHAADQFADESAAQQTDQPNSNPSSKAAA